MIDHASQIESVVKKYTAKAREELCYILEANGEDADIDVELKIDFSPAASQDVDVAEASTEPVPDNMDEISKTLYAAEDKIRALWELQINGVGR